PAGRSASRSSAAPGRARSSSPEAGSTPPARARWRRRRSARPRGGATSTVKSTLQVGIQQRRVHAVDELVLHQGGQQQNSRLGAGQDETSDGQAAGDRLGQRSAQIFVLGDRRQVIP